MNLAKVGNFAERMTGMVRHHKIDRLEGGEALTGIRGNHGLEVKRVKENLIVAITSATHSN